MRLKNSIITLNPDQFEELKEYLETMADRSTEIFIGELYDNLSKDVTELHNKTTKDLKPLMTKLENINTSINTQNILLEKLINVISSNSNVNFTPCSKHKFRVNIHITSRVSLNYKKNKSIKLTEYFGKTKLGLYHYVGKTHKVMAPTTSSDILELVESYVKALDPSILSQITNNIYCSIICTPASDGPEYYVVYDKYNKSAKLITSKEYLDALV